MEHYNMIITDDEKIELKIIDTQMYLNQLRHNPGWLHSNKGDFYSNVKPGDLVGIIYDALGEAEFMGEKMNSDTERVHEKVFNYENVDPDKMYIIGNMGGVTLFAQAYQNRTLTESTYNKLSYEFAALAFLPKLFANDEGTLAKSLKEFEELNEQITWKTGIPYNPKKE